MVLVQRGHPRAQGGCWAQPRSFRGAEQQARVGVVWGLGIANICFPSVLAPSPGAGQIWCLGAQTEPFAFAWMPVEL